MGRLYGVGRATRREGVGEWSLPVGCPRRLPPFDEGPEPFLRLLGHALPGDDPRGVPLRGPVAESADLTDDRLRGPDRGRTRREDVGDRLVDRGIERLDALDDLVDESDSLRANRV